jgi:predicted NAD/FAD-binding protein
VRSAEGLRCFDRVVLAVHSDQALGLLADPTPLERRILGSIAYQSNDVVLHTDESLLAQRPAARASWNYRVPRRPGRAAIVTYDMNRLQGIRSSRRLLVTLNAGERIAADRVLRRFSYQHPILDAAAVAAQTLRDRISGAHRTHFCGAYWGHGFHEDGLASALSVCSELGLGG